MTARWNIKKEKELIKLVKENRYTYNEIGKLMGLSKNQVATKANALGLKNSYYLKSITKHKHLRENILKYFRFHSFADTANHFNLTNSELKSCLTRAYKDPKLKHIRKDLRRHDSWSEKEIMFLIHRLGLIKRIDISKKLKRSKKSYYAVKEQLYRMKCKSKHFHGLSFETATLIFPKKILNKYAIKTKAGPNKPFNIKIIPWVTLERLSTQKNFDPIFAAIFKCQSKLQKWFYKSSSEEEVILKIKKIIGEK